MVKIMAMCDTHKVGIVPHFTGPIGTAGHVHTMTAFPGQVLMEFNAATAGTVPRGQGTSRISASSST